MASVVHIGSNKAASTTLQRHLFARHPRLHYVGHDGAGYERYHSLLWDLLETDDMFWDAAPAERLFQQELAAAGDKTFVFSAEDVVTSPIASQCARRLRKLVGEADVLLIIRNQTSAIESYYAGHGAFLRPAPEPYYKRFVPLDRWLQYNFDVARHGPVTGFDYYRIASFFEDLFGKERMRILVYEELVTRPLEFYSRLAEILRVSIASVEAHLTGRRERERPSTGIHLYETWRRRHAGLSQWLPAGEKIKRLLDGGGRTRIELPPVWRRRIHDRYAAGNERLAVKYGLPLQECGYPLP
jgi:hypothetical protein